MSPGSATAARPAYPAAGAANYRSSQAAQSGVGAMHAYAPSTRAPAMTGGARPTFSRSASFNYHGRAFAAVVASPYHYYHDFSYRAFTIHDRFPAFLLINTNFISKYYMYNLAPPPPGYVWVRFGPDAVLVNSFTGDIIDTAPGLFAEADPNAPPPEDGPPPAYGEASAGPDSDGASYPGPNGFPPPADGAQPPT